MQGTKVNKRKLHMELHSNKYPLEIRQFMISSQAQFCGIEGMSEGEQSGKRPSVLWD